MKRLLLPVLLFLAAFPVSAQHTLRGRCVEGTTPIGYVTAVLLRNGEQAAGSTSDAAGRFVLEADTGRYTLVLRHISYQSIEREVEIGAEDRDLGDIELVANAIAGVTVTAQSITRQADRYVLTVSNSPAMAGENATELLARAPGVWLGEKEISINGSGGTKVYVDGRELKGSAEETAAYLRSMTAADIERVEVVPLAGAEFSADTRGGAILITLRRRRNNGLDGNLQLSSTQGKWAASYAPSGRISVRTGRWTLSGSGSGELAPRIENKFSEQREQQGEQLDFNSISTSKSRSNQGRGRFSAIYDPSPNHSAGIELEYTTRSTRMPIHAFSAQESTLSQSRYDQHISGSTFTATGNYSWKIDTLGSQFKLIADYTRYTSDGKNDYTTTIQEDRRLQNVCDLDYSAVKTIRDSMNRDSGIFSTTSSTTSRDSVYRSAINSTYNMLAADAGVTYKLPHSLTLRSGVRYTRNAMKDGSHYETQTGGEWQPLTTFSYQQHYTEQIAAAYASLSAQIGHWDLSAGIRGEYTAISGTGVDRSYFEIFPNLSVNYALNDLRTWMLVAQWGRNIERPTFAALNPARIQISDYNWQSGNPALRPTYIQRFSLTTVWKYRYTLTIGGNLHHNLIREVARQEEDNAAVIYIRPENHYTENHWFIAVNAPLKITRWWNLTINAVGVMQRIRLTRSDIPSTHYLLFTSAISSFTLPAGFFVEATYRGQSRLYSGNSEVGRRHTLGVTLKKQFLERQLTLFVTADNLTDRPWEFASTTDGMRRTIDSRQGWSQRSWKAGVSWNFRSGKKFRQQKIESAAGTERKRLTKDTDQTN